MSKLRRMLAWVGGTIAVVAAVFGLWVWTGSEGLVQARDLAREQGWCSPPSLCEEEGQEVIKTLAEYYEISPSSMQWCLGVMKLDEAKVYRGGWLKSLAVQAMAFPCGGLFSGVTKVKSAG